MVRDLIVPIRVLQSRALKQQPKPQEKSESGESGAGQPGRDGSQAKDDVTPKPKTSPGSSVARSPPVDLDSDVLCQSGK